MTDDNLIEKAAKAIYETSVVSKFEEAAEWDREIVMDEARAALTVFEEAHAKDLATSAERVKNPADSSNVPNVTDREKSDIQDRAMAGSEHVPTECRDCGRTDGGCDRIMDAATDSTDLTARADKVTPTDDELRDAIDHIQGAVEFQDAINPEAIRVVIPAALRTAAEVPEPRPCHLPQSAPPCIGCRCEPQGEPSDALLSEIEQKVYDDNRGQIAGMAKALVRAGWDAARGVR